MTVKGFISGTGGALVNVLAGEDRVAEHGGIGDAGDDVAGLWHVPRDRLSLDLWHGGG